MLLIFDTLNSVCLFVEGRIEPFNLSSWSFSVCFSTSVLGWFSSLAWPSSLDQWSPSGFHVGCGELIAIFDVIICAFQRAQLTTSHSRFSS